MDLGKSSITKLLWYYSIPSLIGTLANALYNIIDRIYIGQGVGAIAISGLALTFPIMNLLGAFGMLVGHGAAARVSLLLGNNNSREANAILPNTFILSLFFYLIVSSHWVSRGACDVSVGVAERCEDVSRNDDI